MGGIMLIRSQNKQNIFNINTINGIGFGEYPDTYPWQMFVLIGSIEYLLGKYSTKEKAIKVLDMIEKEYNKPTYINDLGSGEYCKYDHSSFQMPQDDEVIV